MFVIPLMYLGMVLPTAKFYRVKQSSTRGSTVADPNVSYVAASMLVSRSLPTNKIDYWVGHLAIW